MIFQEFPIPLTFYDNIRKQNRFKENAGNVDVFELIAANDSILPFQFRNDLGSALSSLQVFTEDGELAASLAINMIISESVSGFQYFTWLGDEQFKNTLSALLNLPCNQYYLKANFTQGLDPLYSEVFKAVSDIENYFLLEWSNYTGDIDPVYYGSGYKNRIYSDTFITKGVPTIEINSEKDGYGNTVVTSRRMINNYDFSLEITPNYIVDAINFMSLHDTIKLNTKDKERTGLIENVTVDQDQIETVALWEVTVKFNQPKFYFNGSCPTPITGPIIDQLIINTGTPHQTFNLIYDAN